MKSEELKEKLSAMTTEGADVAAITDEIMTDYADRLEEISKASEKDAKIAELTATIAGLNETNMKLIERIKYQDDGDDGDDTPRVTLENLFD